MNIGVYAREHGNEHSGVIKHEDWGTVSFSWKAVLRLYTVTLRAFIIFRYISRPQ